MKSIRVLVAEDHTLVRAGIVSLLGGLQDVVVVAEASDGREAISQFDQHQPDLILMDITMRGLNGLEATARILKNHPQARILILSMHMNEEYVLQALRAGASGYLLKDCETNELEFAIRAVAQGKTYLSPSIAEHVTDYLRFAEGNAEPSRLERLTSRQREVLQLIAEGHTTKEIAGVLNVSTHTADTHRNQLMKTLDIHDVAGLVRFAMQVGLIQNDR
jgi:DNA-binding NarL/FixJ family response regulator